MGAKLDYLDRHHDMSFALGHVRFKRLLLARAGCLRGRLMQLDATTCMLHGMLMADGLANLPRVAGGTGGGVEPCEQMM